jgi:hypothetical protein
LRFIPFTVGFGEEENAGFRPPALEVNFSAGYDGRQDMVFDDTWLESSEFVIMRSTEGGAVERRISLADFPIPAQ